VNLDTKECQAITEALSTQGGRLFSQWLSDNFDKTMKELLRTDVERVELTRGRAGAFQDILKFIHDINSAARK